RSRSIFEVIDDVRVKVEAAVPRLRIEFVQILSDVINDLAGAARPVEIKLYGPDLERLEVYAESIEPKIAAIDGVEDLYNGVSEPSAELDMHVNQAESNRVGLTPQRVAEAAMGALLGAFAGEVRLEDRSIGVRVRAPDSVRFNRTALNFLPIVSSQNAATIPLGTLATFEPVETRAELLRENQQQMIAMTSDVSGPSLGPVMKAVKSVRAAPQPPAGIRHTLAGLYARQKEAFASLLLVLAMAAASVVAVMVIQ